MRYHALACDYDGTVADGGKLLDATRLSLERLRATGRKIILVTGRRLDDLLLVCPDLSTFDIVVAENGAVLHWPSTNEVRMLVEPPPALFVETLARLGVRDVAVGHVIVATWQPQELLVLDAIRDLGLEMQVIFNKGAVMVLPSGVNKGTGLRAALDTLRLSPHNVVGIGDAENDHALLAAVECGAAVANALPMLKERADLVTGGDHGAGVAELAERLIRDDLADVADRLSRHDLPIGTDRAQGPVTLPAHGATVLLVGTSGAGKSTFATAFFERLDERGYQYCIIDPEGDHGELPQAIISGSREAVPDVDELVKVLDRPSQSVVVNLLGVGIHDRPPFFEALLPRLQVMRAQSGHPHWVVLDEAHHLAPRGEAPATVSSGGDLKNLFLITVHPGHVSPALLSAVDVVVVVGASPRETLAEFASVIGLSPPDVDPAPLNGGEAMVWWPRRGTAVTLVQTIPPQTERRRHVRKYATGELPPERSFYFRGPEGKLNLRAQNLMSFLQIAEGVDDETWLFHLAKGEYSAWLKTAIKDDQLAQDIAAIERQYAGADSAAAAPAAAVASRRAVKAAIEQQYTASH